MEEKEKEKEEVVSDEEISEEEKDISPVLSVYEIGYLMVPTIPEEGLGAEVTLFKDSLLEKGVIFISDEYPKLIELAYEMIRSIDNKKQKFSYGYFGWVKFECTPTEAKEIKSFLEKNEKLIRYLMIKTVRENTMSVKRTYNKQDGSKRKVFSRPEETEVINEETIDKEIEALVVE